MHQVETMAFTSQVPWHGLGNKLAPRQPIEIWRQQAGMDWKIEESEVHYLSWPTDTQGLIHRFPEQKVLYRSDTQAPLAVVFNNTLQIAVGQRTGAIKVPHRSQFKPDQVKQQRGITVSAWDGLVDGLKALCDRPVDPDSVYGLLRRVLVYGGQGTRVPAVNEQAVASVRALYEGGGRGAMLASSRGTAWGVLNSLTEFVDHHRRARSDDHRRDAAWFRQGAAIKQRAWDEVLKLVA
jgi:hypothetical protein